MVQNVTITLPEDVCLDFRERKARENLNLSNFFSNAYRREFMEDIMLIRKYNSMMKRTLDLKAEIERRKETKDKEELSYQKILKENPKLGLQELRFLVTAKRRIQNNKDFLIPNYRAYCSIFRDIAQESFTKKIDKIVLEEHPDVQDYVQDGTHNVEVKVR